MISRFALLVLSFLSLLNANQSAILDSIRTALHQPGGLILEIKIIHQQYGQDWIENATLSIDSSGNYLIETTDQVIQVLDRDIYTWNKSGQQVVIDQINPQDISILDILTGDFNLLEIDSVENSGQVQIISFNIISAEITGLIEIKSADYLPSKIILNYNADDGMTLRIESVEQLNENNRIPGIELIRKEIIDLRE